MSQRNIGRLQRDENGNISHAVLVNSWRVNRITLPTEAWTLAGDEEERSSLMIQAPSTNSGNIIMHSDSLGGNDPAFDDCGIELAPGERFGMNCTSNVEVWVRPAAGAGVQRVVIAEAK